MGHSSHELIVIVCVCVCSDISQLGDIAEAIQARLDSYKADKRELGTVSHVAIVLAQSEAQN